jgi:anti-sigma regulatory factor (Ser/Thr protein kinase)
MPRPESRRLLLHNDLAELQRLAAWLDGWAQQALSSDLSFAVQLCLEEAVANVIMYGGSARDHLEIAVEVEDNGATLVAHVVDNGRPFDPTEAPRPPMASSLAQARIGNLGIHLMRSFASSMQYERRDGCNRLTLQFSGPQPERPRAG